MFFSLNFKVRLEEGNFTFSTLDSFCLEGRQHGGVEVVCIRDG